MMKYSMIHEGNLIVICTKSYDIKFINNER